jgi:nucleotide-binding universal stress UspA family protein
LIRIAGPGVDKAILSNLRTGSKQAKITLCECAADRNMQSAVPALLELILGDDQHVTKAALESMAKVAEQKDIPAMVALLSELNSPALQTVAGKSIASTIMRQTDREQAAAAILAVYPDTDRQDKTALLGVMGQVGGNAVLETVKTELKNSDEQLKDAAVRAIAGWPNDAALTIQYALSRNAENQIHRVLALRGYVRSIGVSSLKNSEKMKLYQKAMAAATRPEDRKSVLSGLGTQQSNAALELAASYMEDAKLKKEAASAVFRIYRNLSASQREKAKPVLQDIIDTSDNEKLVEGAKKAMASKPRKKK